MEFRRVGFVDGCEQIAQGFFLASAGGERAEIDVEAGAVPQGDVQIWQGRADGEAIAVIQTADVEAVEEPDDILAGRAIGSDVDPPQAEACRRGTAADLANLKVAGPP